MRSVQPVRRRHPRGFTLVEVGVVLGIIAVLAAMVAIGVSASASRVRSANATFSFVTLFPIAQSRAQAQSTDHFVAVFEKGTSRGAYVFYLPTGVATPADWATVDLSSPASFGAKVVEDVKLQDSDSERSAYASLAGTALGETLPAPFGAIALEGTGATGLKAACNFCIDGAGGSAGGVIRFLVDGTVEIASVSAPAGGALALSGTGVKAGRPRVVAISAPAGAVRVYE